VEQPTEPIASHDPPRQRQDNWLAGLKRRLPQGAVRAAAVVMVNVRGQDRLQLPAAHDQHPIQHLPPDGAHPAMGGGILPAPRRPHRRVQHLHRLGSKDRVERGGVLGVPIADQEPESPVRSSRAMNGAVALVLKESGGETLAMTTAQAERRINSTSHPSSWQKIRRNAIHRSSAPAPPSAKSQLGAYDRPTGTHRHNARYASLAAPEDLGGRWQKHHPSRDRRELPVHRPGPTLDTLHAPSTSSGRSSTCWSPRSATPRRPTGSSSAIDTTRVTPAAANHRSGAGVPSRAGGAAARRHGTARPGRQ
jgi:hypothetical protein